MPADNAFGFVATEYVSQGGHGSTMLKRVARGWTVSVWLGGGRGYVSIGGEPSATALEAMDVYRAWIASRLAGEVEW